MKSRASEYQSSTPLNTQDVTRMAGVSRRMLEHYEETGLLVPSRIDNTERAKKQWSVDQAMFTERVRIMQHDNASIEDIVRIADGGHNAFLGEFYRRCTREVRDGWRQLRSAKLDQKRCNDALAVGSREGLYLRYLPLHWYELMPIDPGDALLPDPGGFGEAFVAMHSVAHVVGWCPASTSGMLASLSCCGQGPATSYALVELAVAPQPVAAVDLPDNGGCYCTVVSEDRVPPCFGESCEVCSRYGRKPTTEELFFWKTEESMNPDQWQHTLMASDMEQPYAYGCWSGHCKLEDGKWDMSALRPRLMPHVERLPLGVTACAMPAGVYLCLQCAPDELNTARRRLLDTLDSLQRREYTAADELAGCERQAAYRASSDARERQEWRAWHEGPINPFMKHEHVDAGVMEWVHELLPGDIPELTLPTNMALRPETGFCMLCTTVPAADRNAVPRLELQVMVDPGALGPEAINSRLWDK